MGTAVPLPETEGNLPAQPSINQSLNIPGDKKSRIYDFDSEFSSVMADVSRLSPSIRRDILSEADSSYTQCRGNVTLANFYDCSCYSLKTMKYRLERGPEVPGFKILDEGDFNDCVSEPLVAGYNYKMCNDILMMQKITDRQLEDVCGCVARTAATEYKNRPVMHIGYIDQLFSDTLDACRTKFNAY